jgi:hypothetical protein
MKLSCLSGHQRRTYAKDAEVVSQGVMAVAAIGNSNQNARHAILSEVAQVNDAIVHILEPTLV